MTLEGRLATKISTLLLVKLKTWRQTITSTELTLKIGKNTIFKKEEGIYLYFFFFVNIIYIVHILQDVNVLNSKIGYINPSQ